MIRNVLKGVLSKHFKYFQLKFDNYGNSFERHRLDGRLITLWPDEKYLNPLALIEAVRGQVGPSS